MKSEAPPKSEWARGPWDTEPDRVDYTHAGYQCLILRTAFGSLCGYVAVPPGHPFWGKHYGECVLHCPGEMSEQLTPDHPLFGLMKAFYARQGADARLHYTCAHRMEHLISVHGGITFADHSDDTYRTGDPDLWWIGFDCNHAWDVAPGMDALLQKLNEKILPAPYVPLVLPDSTYRDLAYVTKETNNLAEQIAAYGLPLYQAQKLHTTE